MPELSDAFLYANSAKDLWQKLCESFGQRNGPLLFYIQKEITELSQGTNSVAVYCTKLKKLWDELQDLSEIPMCRCPTSCTAMKKYIVFGERQKLIKFLIHLDDEYDAIRGQILLMDPLPDLNKAYSMVVRVEKPKQFTSYINAGNEIAACAHQTGTGNEIANITTSGILTRGTSKERRDNKKNRSSRYSDHCHGIGHTQD